MPHISEPTGNFPLVSIVTPAYNQGDYLAETIESVLAQDYPNLEYIVIDDGSTDATPAVLFRYRGRVRFERQINMGQARTLNKGWAMCKGEYLGYVSSDDTLSPNAISTLVTALAKDSSTTVAYCDYDLMDGNSCFIRSIQTEDFNVDRLTTHLVCQPGPGALFRRDLISDFGYWDPDLTFVADYEFWLRCAHRGKFQRVAAPLARFRIHEGSGLFKPISASRSSEIVSVMQRYWKNEPGLKASKSIAKAHLVAARSHAQSGRYAMALHHLASSARRHPPILVAAATWKMLASGLFRRAYHKLMSRIRA